jgi:uncharacterized spore protein YtfJ
MDTQDLITKVTETVQKNANTKAVFGDPIEKDGVTVIPVSKVSYSGGGGGGQGKEPREEKVEGSGMGLGLHIKNSPVGYIEIKGGEAVFKRISSKEKLFLMGTVLGIFGMMSIVRILTSFTKR